MADLNGKNVVVIGGTSGIGLATVAAAVVAGANVWGAGRTQTNIDAAKGAVPRARLKQLDTHDVAALEALFSKVGTVDHLVAAATGANRTTRPFMEQTEEQFSEAFNKFWGYTRVVRAGIPHLADDGSVTFVSGIPARKCNPNMSSISCVGNAVEGLTRALAIELTPKRVNVVAPGIIDTGMHAGLGDKKEAAYAQMSKAIPLGRVGQSEEVADAIMLCMTNGFMTGATIDVDGGALLP